jgi:hypothetical protein
MGSLEGVCRLSKAELEQLFPNLAGDVYEITSPKARRYNCVAWAAQDNTRKWDCPLIPSPGYYWPSAAGRGDGIEALVSVFGAQGYELCEDGSLEEGFEKVALYADEAGEWTHAARQLANGRWTSKMGDAEDLVHSSPGGVADSIYGHVWHFMKRRKSASKG